MENEFASTFGFQHRWACEKVEWKVLFMQAMFPNVPMFENIHELHKELATLVDKTQRPVPKIDIGIFGFECDSIAAANNHRASNSSCIEDESGKTGQTFKVAARLVIPHLSVFSV